MIDESEVLTPADPFYHTNKHDFTIPFVCGCRNLGEAVRRIWEGAAMMRTKGEAGTGNIIEAVRHQHMVNRMINELQTINDTAVYNLAEVYIKSYIDAYETLTAQKPSEDTVLFGSFIYKMIRKDIIDLIKEIRDMNRLPVVNFAAGGVATPADAALMMQMGSDGVFVGSGIFKSNCPEDRAKAIVESVAHYDDPEVIIEVSKNLGEAMVGINIDEIPAEQRLQERGW